jgi:hypothetical protein
LSFAFADSPRGGGEADTPDVSGGRAFLLHTAKQRPAADAAETACGTGISSLPASP